MSKGWLKKSGNRKQCVFSLLCLTHLKIRMTLVNNSDIGYLGNILRLRERPSWGSKVVVDILHNRTLEVGFGPLKWVSAPSQVAGQIWCIVLAWFLLNTH